MFNPLDHIKQSMESGMYKIPAHMHDGVRRYILQGIPMGSFGTALFANDFMGAIGLADADNHNAIALWADFIYNNCPAGCHGSYKKVEQWQAQEGAKVYETQV